MWLGPCQASAPEKFVCWWILQGQGRTHATEKLEIDENDFWARLALEIDQGSEQFLNNKMDHVVFRVNTGSEIVYVFFSLRCCVMIHYQIFQNINVSLTSF